VDCPRATALFRTQLARQQRDVLMKNGVGFHDADSFFPMRWRVLGVSGQCTEIKPEVDNCVWKSSGPDPRGRISSPEILDDNSRAEAFRLLRHELRNMPESDQGPTSNPKDASDCYFAGIPMRPNHEAILSRNLTRDRRPYIELALGFTGQRS
jgi:hypothetical protein